MELNEFNDFKDVELIGCRSQSRLHRPEAGEFVGLYRASLPNGEKVHLAYELEWDKRDCLREVVRSDRSDLRMDSMAESPSVWMMFDPHNVDKGENPVEHAEWGRCLHRLWGDE